MTRTQYPHHGEHSKEVNHTFTVDIPSTYSPLKFFGVRPGQRCCMSAQNNIPCPHKVIHAGQINDVSDHAFVIDAETIEYSKL